MGQRIITRFAILLLFPLGLACSFLRPKPPLTWHMTLEVDAVASDRDAAVQQLIRVTERRLNLVGVSNFVVQAQGRPANGRLRVSLPDVPDRERLKKLITAIGRLQLTAVISPASPAPAQTYRTKEEAIASLGGTVPANRRVLPYVERAELATGGDRSERWVVVEFPPIVDGSDLRNATAFPSRAGEDYQIAFALTPTGAEKIGSWTGSHINDYLGVVLNDEVKSIAYIKGQISDQGQISGRFTKESAEDLAQVLNSGALPAAVKIVEEGSDK